MKINKRKIALTLVPILLIAGTAALLHSHVKRIDRVPTMPRLPWALPTASVDVGSVVTGFPALGRVVTSSQIRIAPQIEGTVVSMGPRAGGRVRKGMLIVQIDTRQLEADLASLRAKRRSAQAVVENDRNELRREQALLEKGGSSASLVERYQTRLHSDLAQLHSLEKQIEALRIRISYGRILSPVDGRIAQRLAEPGDTVFPGKPVYVITANQGGRVTVPVPLDTVTRIHVGSEVRLSSGGQTLKAAITRVNPSLDKLAMGSFEIDLPERPFGLPDGAPIAAYVVTDRAGPGTTVPIDALRPASDGDERILFKVVPGHEPKLRMLRVDVRLCGRQRCLVEGQLQSGDHVVSAHGSILLRLHDGDRILADGSDGAARKTGQAS